MKLILTEEQVVRLKKYLNEGVEYMTDKEGNKHHFRDKDINCFAFALYDNQINLSSKNNTHGELIVKNFGVKYDDNAFYKINGKLQARGRVWLDFKVISFWFEPTDEILEIVKSELQRIFKNEDISKYKVEYL